MIPEPLVFIVDDDEAYGSLLRGIVRGLGATAQVSARPEGVLDAIAAARPAVVVVDLWMPGLDGPSLCRLLRAREEFDGVQLLLCSALDEEAIGEVAQTSGADGYFTKTAGLGAVRGALQGAIDRWKSGREGPSDAPQ